jgi:hypothetical protein
LEWKIYNNAQYTVYVNHPKKALKGDFAATEGGLSGLRPRLSGQSDGRLDLVRGGQRIGELEQNSRKPRDLVGQYCSNSLKRVNLLFLSVR